MLKHRVAYATLAAALAACGTEETTRLPSVPEIEDPEAYFALQPCSCWEFVRADGASPIRLGIAVESVGSDAPGSDGEQEYVLTYRVGGLEQRRDVLRLEETEVLLRQARVGSQVSTTWIAEPPLPWLVYPVEPRSQAIESDVTLSDFSSVEEPISTRFRATYGATTVEGSRDNGETTETFDAVRIRYQGLPFDEGLFRSFVPELGWVQVEMEVDGARTNFVLHNVRTLGGNCPVAPGDRPDDICGTIN